MGTVFSGLKWKNCLVYLDSVNVSSRTFDEHTEQLEVVLHCIRSTGLDAEAAKKYHFCFEEL